MKKNGIIIFSSVIAISYTALLSYFGNILFSDGYPPINAFIIIAFAMYLSFYFVIIAFSSPTKLRIIILILAICIATWVNFYPLGEKYYGNELFTILTTPGLVGVCYLSLMLLTKKETWVISFSLVFFIVLLPLFILGLMFVPAKKTTNELLSEILSILDR